MFIKKVKFIHLYNTVKNTRFRHDRRAVVFVELQAQHSTNCPGSHLVQVDVVFRTLYHLAVPFLFYFSFRIFYIFLVQFGRWANEPACIFMVPSNAPAVFVSVVVGEGENTISLLELVCLKLLVSVLGLFSLLRLHSSS